MLTASRSFFCDSYSARFRAHLQSNQLPFKSTIFPGWFMDRIQPWVHYVSEHRSLFQEICSCETLQVPVRVDYADLYDVLAFFDGGLDAARTGNHDDLAEEIAMAGSDWAHGFWRLDDMRACTCLSLALSARQTTLTACPAQIPCGYSSNGPGCLTPRGNRRRNLSSTCKPL